MNYLLYPLMCFFCFLQIPCISNEYIDCIEQESDCEKRFYAGLWVGGTHVHDRIDEVSIDYHLGVAGGVKAGMRVYEYVAIEVEGLYLQNNIKDIEFKHTKTGVKGHIKSYSALANVLLRVPFQYIIPYLGGGVGYGYEKIHFHATGLNVSHTDSHFVYQGIVGLAIPIGCFYSLPFLISLEGRYFVFENHVSAAILDLGFTFKF